MADGEDDAPQMNEEDERQNEAEHESGDEDEGTVVFYFMCTISWTDCSLIWVWVTSKFWSSSWVVVGHWHWKSLQNFAPWPLVHNTC